VFGTSKLIHHERLQNSTTSVQAEWAEGGDREEAEEKDVDKNGEEME